MKYFVKLTVILIILVQVFACSKDKSLEYYNAKIVTYLNNDEYEKAIKIGTEMKNNYPEKALSYYDLGYVYFYTEEYKKAEKLFLLSMEKYQKYDMLSKRSSLYRLKDAYYFLAKSYQSEDNKMEAIKFYDKTIAIDSTKVKAYAHTATIYAKLEKYKKAINYVNNGLKQCITIDDRKELSKIKKNILWSIENYSTLNDILNAELETCTEDSLRDYFYIMRYYNLYCHGYFSEVIKGSSNFVNKDNYNGLIILFRGLSYLNNNAYKKAIQTFELIKKNNEISNRIISKNIITFEYNIEMILTYLLMNNRSRAKEYYKKIGMTKEKLLNYEEFNDFISLIGLYQPHKDLLMKFIKSQPE